MTISRRTALAALLTAALAGCGGNGRHAADDSPPVVTALREVGELLRGPKPPAKPADLDRGKQMYPRGVRAVTAGEVVVLWGGGLAGEGEAAAGGGSVVAYEKDAPTAGGYVLLTSGEVKKLSAAEFSAAPKTGKK